MRPRCAVVFVLRLGGVEHNVDPWETVTGEAGFGETRGEVTAPPDIDPPANKGELCKEE